MNVCWVLNSSKIWLPLEFIHWVNFATRPFFTLKPKVWHTAFEVASWSFGESQMYNSPPPPVACQWFSIVSQSHGRTGTRQSRSCSGWNLTRVCPVGGGGIWWHFWGQDTSSVWTRPPPGWHRQTFAALGTKKEKDNIQCSFELESDVWVVTLVVSATSQVLAIFSAVKLTQSLSTRFKQRSFSGSVV